VGPDLVLNALKPDWKEMGLGGCSGRGVPEGSGTHEDGTLAQQNQVEGTCQHSTVKHQLEECGVGWGGVGWGGVGWGGVGWGGVGWGGVKWGGVGDWGAGIGPSISPPLYTQR